MSRCLIALGANVGEKERNVRRAIELLNANDLISVLRSSRIYQTAPVGGPKNQDTFANAAVLAETGLSPEALLQCLLEIEIEFGRQRDVRWQARVLDLDLLLYDKLTISDERFVLPHPRMSFRRFVLEPCAEIAAEMVHPLLEMTIGELLEAINLRPPLISLRSEMHSAAIHLAHRICQMTNSIVFWPGRNEGQLTEIALPNSEKKDLSVEFSAWQQVEHFFPRDTLPQSEQEKLADHSTVAPYVICIELAAGADQVEQCSPTPRLAVAMLDCQQQSADRLQLEAKQRLLRNYRGPFLAVDAEDLDSATIELVAAIEAMR